MKTKKLLAILLTVVMVLSMSISAGAAGDRAESVMLQKGVEDFSDGVFDADDGNYGTPGFFGTGTETDTPVKDTPIPDANTTLSIGNEEGRGNYAIVNTTTTSNGQYAARMIFQKTFGISETKALGIEYKFRLPSKDSKGTAIDDKTNVSVWISDNIYGRNRSNIMCVKKYSGTWGFYLNSTNTLLTALQLDKWYGFRVEYITRTSESLARYRISIFDENGEFITQATSSQSGRATRELGMISFGQNACEAEFHVDDFYAYSFNASDFNQGSVFFKEDFAKYVTTDEAITGDGAKYSYGWTETKNWNGGSRAISMIFGNKVPASETKRVNAVCDEGSTNKFFRTKATVDNSDYIQFRIDTVSQLTEMDNKTKNYPEAIVFGAKVRIDDTSKDNAIELWTKTAEYAGADGTAYAAKEAQFLLIEPDLKAVSIGFDKKGDKQVYKGLEMESDVWYDLKFYYNDTIGYGRLEITNPITGKTQIFEGKYTQPGDCDLSSISAWGFVTRFTEANIIDYDDLTLTAWNPNAASMAKTFDASAITLSKEAIEPGEIKATVDVTGYCGSNDVTTEVANLIFASYNGDRISEIEFVSVKPNTYTAEATLTIPEEGTENYKVKAMLWNSNMNPIVESAMLGDWE